MIGVGDPAWIAISTTAFGLGLLLLIAYIVFRRPAGGVRAKLGALEVTLDAVHQAVNDRPGGPTLSEQVAVMAVKVETIERKVTTLATELAAHIMANPGLPPKPTGPPRPRYGA